MFLTSSKGSLWPCISPSVIAITTSFTYHCAFFHVLLFPLLSLLSLSALLTIMHSSMLCHYQPMGFSPHLLFLLKTHIRFSTFIKPRSALLAPRITRSYEFKSSSNPQPPQAGWCFRAVKLWVADLSV